MQHKPDNQAGKELVDFLLQELNLIGLQEIMSEQRVETIFTRLLRERGLYISRINSASIMEQERFSSGTCPFCQTPILDEAHQVFCKSCGIPHHAECWQENGQCAVFGCGQKQNLNNGLVREEVRQLIVLGEDDLADEPEDNKVKVSDAEKAFWGIFVGSLFLFFLILPFLKGC